MLCSFLLFTQIILYISYHFLLRSYGFCLLFLFPFSFVFFLFFKQTLKNAFVGREKSTTYNESLAFVGKFQLKLKSHLNIKTHKYSYILNKSYALNITIIKQSIYKPSPKQCQAAHLQYIYFDSYTHLVCRQFSCGIQRMESVLPAHNLCTHPQPYLC